MNVFSATIKDRFRCYASWHYEENGYIGTRHIYNAGKTLYMYIYSDRSRVVELLLHLDSKQQIMTNNVS